MFKKKQQIYNENVILYNEYFYFRILSTFCNEYVTNQHNLTYLNIGKISKKETWQIINHKVVLFNPLE